MKTGYKESENLTDAKHVEAAGRNKNSTDVVIVSFASQEGAPADTAPFTDQAGEQLSRHFNPAAAKNLNISLGKIVKVENKRTGPDDEKNAVSPNGVRNWDNVFNAYKKHYLGVVYNVLSSNGNCQVLGVGGDHGMGASTVRANIFSYGILDICNGKIKCRDDVKARIEELRNIFQENPNEENLQAIGSFLDQSLEDDKEMMAAWKASAKKMGLVWFDAHGDINTPMDMLASESKAPAQAVVKVDAQGELVKFASPSPSGNYHGMPVATAMGFGPAQMVEFGSKHANIHPSRITFIAIRDLDAIEIDAIRMLHERFGLKVVSPENLREDGMERYLAEVAILASDGGRVIVEHDIDGGNAARYPATGTPVGPGSTRNTAAGPGHHVVRNAIRNLMLMQGVIAVDMAELAGLDNSTTNSPNKTPAQLNALETFHSGMQLVCSALGLTTEQKHAVFPGALNLVDSRHHKETKKGNVGFETELADSSITLRGKAEALRRQGRVSSL